MKYLKNLVTTEVTIKKSKFITILEPITSDSDILPIIQRLKKEYPKATHYCYAYLIGDSAQFGGSNDDGEPAGTAGVPMLEVLKQNNVTNLLAVVIRYYGGIHLGAGGLIRAYSGGVADAIKEAVFYTLIKATLFELHFNYDQIGDIEYLLQDEEIVYKEYLKDVVYKVAIKNLDAFCKIKHHFFEIKKLEETLLAVDLKQ